MHHGESLRIKGIHIISTSPSVQVGVIATNFIGVPDRGGGGNQALSPDERPIDTQSHGRRPQKHTGGR